MKKLLTSFCAFFLFWASAQNDNHVHPKHVLRPLKNNLETELVKGFDKDAAWDEAKKKYKDASAQAEYFESLTRKYIAQKKAKSPIVNATVPYASSYDAGTKTIDINLTPFSTYCPNAGFENANFGGWTGDTWTLSGTDWTTVPSWTSGIQTIGTNSPAQPASSGFASPTQFRHTIMNIPPTLNNPPANCIGWDSIAINPATHQSDIPFVPPTGSGVTCRLGNANTGSETERIRYSMLVSAQNAQFNFSYAVVLQNPSGHGTTEQPFFQINMYDQSGSPIAGCGNYQIDAYVASSDPSFHSASVWDDFTPGWIDPSNASWSSYALYYKKWTLGAIDLTPYIGQTVTLEFRTADCSQGGHFGYAYIDASCQFAQATVNMCPGSSNAVLVAPPGYTSYQWYGPNSMTAVAGATNDSLNIASANLGDVYTVSVVAAAGCSAQMQVTIVTTPISIINTNSTPSCVSGASGTAQVTASGSTTGYNYVWTNASTGASVGGNSGSISNLPPGTYSVVVSAPNCGSSTADTTIVVGVSPPVYYTSSQNYCGSTVAVAAPTGSNYTWYDPTGNLIPGAINQNLNVANVTDGDAYTVVFSNATGCRDSVKITLSQTINSSTQNTTFCGTSATLTVPSGATNTVWYDASWPYSQLGTGNSITINNPVVSTWDPYYVSYTDPTTGCKDSAQIYLTNAPASAYPSGIVPACAGSCNGSATLNYTSNISAPYTLTVTGPNGYSSSNAAATAIQSLTNLCSGSYTAAFSDGQCTASTTFSISTMSVNVTVSAPSQDTICSGQQATVTFSYGSGAPAQCGPATSGCGSTTTSTLGTGTLQNTSTGNPSVYGNWYGNEKYQILYSASDLLSAGITPGKISSIAFDVASIPSGMYTTFKNYQIKIGCTSQADLDPNGLGSGVPFASGANQVVWGPQNYTLVTGWNTHNFTTPWEWDGVSNLLVEICFTINSAMSPVYSSNAIMNQTATSYTSFLGYFNDSSPACGATTTSGFSDVFMQRPNTRFLHCQSTPSPTDFTYSWSPNTGVSGTPPTINLAPGTSTTYSLSITSNFGSCVKTDSVALVVINPFVINMPSSVTYCVGSPKDTLTASTTPAGPTGTWSGAGMVNSGNNADGYFTPASAGIGNWFEYFTAAQSGCTIKDSVELIVNGAANALVSPVGPFCENAAAINLSPASPGGLFSGNGITDQVNGTFSPSAAGAGTSTIKYVVGAPCADSSTINIIVHAQPTLAATYSDTAGCNPLKIDFVGTALPAPANGSAICSFGDGTASTSLVASHTYQDTGNFTVTFTYTDLNGCSDTVNNTNAIHIYPAVIADFTPSPDESTILEPTVHFTNLSLNADTFYWQLTPDSSSMLQNPVFEYQDVGTYTVMLAASNQYGCPDTIYKVITINPDVALYVPNAFTPGDENGLNDVFLPYLSGIDNSSFIMDIYDRWGERIFNTSDVTKGWNGKKNNSGQLVNADVFVWKIYYKDTKNKHYTKIGHVTVVR